MRQGVRTFAAAVGVVLIGSLLATHAVAKRPASDEERTAMASAVGFPPDCVVAQVSTVDSTWGLVKPRSLTGCPEADGVAWLRREGSGWRVVANTPADKVACPGKAWPVDHAIPARIAQEFGYCRKARTYVMCQPKHNHSDFSRDLKVRPRRCDTLGPRDSFAEGANLASLRWRSWGRGTARARGIERGYHLPYSHIRVRVRAYRRRRCPDGDYLYTRLRATSRYGTTVRKFPRSCSD